MEEYTLDVTTTEETEETNDELSLGAELAKTLLISATTTVGMIAGAAAVGAVRNKIVARRARKAAEAETLAQTTPTE